MLQSSFAHGSPVEFRFESRLSQERPKRTDPLRPAFEKLSKKTSQNIWQFENNSLPLHPLLRSEPRSWAPKKLRKKFRKNLEDMRKTPYLCNRFPLENGSVKKSDLWRDLHKQYSSTRAKLETVSGKTKEPSVLIYIGNELLIRNPDRANDRLYSARDMVIKRYFYNEEFDPGSGWTLATGLTHASRGAAWLKLASVDGDRRTGE